MVSSPVPRAAGNAAGDEKKMEKKTLGILALTTLMMLAGAAAFGGFGWHDENPEFGEGMDRSGSRAQMQEKRVAARAAIEAGDPSLLPEGCPMAENFDRFVEMHEAREAGDFETAQAIMEELGIQRKGRMRGGMGKGFRMGGHNQ